MDTEKPDQIITMHGISYFEIEHPRYKYKLAEDFKCVTRIAVPAGVGISKYFYFDRIDDKDEVTIYRGYCWDGASGPTWDTPDTMRASLVHDVFYQCFREGILSRDWRKAADKLFRKMCLEDGMSKFRANYFYLAVRTGGWFSARGSASRMNP